MTDLISRADAIDAVRKVVIDNDAVEALKALPSAELPKGDLISRADVLKYPIRLDHYDEENGSRQFVYGVESVIEYVESLPSADRPRGEWTKEIEGNGWNEWENITCSLCGAKVEKVKYLGCGRRWNYCPNCGARMKGGDTE